MYIEPNTLDKSGFSNRWPPRLVFLVTCILSGHLFWFVSLYAENLLYHDQWDLYRPMFDEAGIFDAFFHQHGPHRQGLGGMATYLLASATDWSTIAESYMIAGCLVLAAFLAIRLKSRLVGGLSYADVAIPLIILNPVQIETILLSPNIAHSVLPLAMLLLIANTWTSQNSAFRYGVSSLLAGMALFTGFGIFVWLGLLSLLIFDCVLEFRGGWRYRSYQSLTSILFLLICIGIFMIGYQWNPANPYYVFPHKPLIDYIAFVDYLFGRLFYLPKIIRPYIGFLVFLSVLIAMVYAFIKYVYSRNEHEMYPVTYLFLATSLLFVGFAAVGRVSLGVDGGGSSRYLTLALPAILAIYFIIVELGQKAIGKMAGAVFAGLMMFSYLSNTFFAHEKSEEKHLAKLHWIQVYQATGSMKEAEETSGLLLYPNIEAIEARMAYMRERKLNLFKD